MNYPQLTTLENDGWELADAEELNKEAPDRFWLPSYEQRTGLKPGQLVKLIFRIVTVNKVQQEEIHVERMWVLVQEKVKSYYLGILDNDPYCTDDIKAGLVVYFESRHIIAVYEE